MGELSIINLIKGIMDIGTGIAIAGVWIMAGLIGASDSVTDKGLQQAQLRSLWLTGFFIVLPYITKLIETL